ncbi:MAG: flippase-like domain-containing protein [Proteobacteria bacterium]|nr:flippase-like domain-containing protein [Pseudomonadota bacterium]
MKKTGGNTLKLVAGLAISVLFLYLAFGKIDLDQMKASFLGVHYWMLIPAALATLVSHWIRSIRWRLLMKSIKRVSVWRLFSATMIGYMGNTVLPAHLGEIFRANIVGNREGISTSSVLATVVIERMVDVLSLLVVMMFTLVVYPFPEWVKKSGYIMFVLAVGLFVFLVLLKRQNERTLSIIRRVLRILPERIAVRIENMIIAFIDGINVMERKRDYLVVFVLSILIWVGYWLNMHIAFYAFDLFRTYDVGAVSSLVLLVITTIAIIVPSSPGYVGTYHYLCQLSLELFGVPRSVGLSFAFVAHALGILPTALVGMVFAWKEGFERLRTEKE